MPTRSFPLEPTPIRVSDEVLDDLRPARRPGRVYADELYAIHIVSAQKLTTLDELVRQRRRRRKRGHRRTTGGR